MKLLSIILIFLIGFSSSFARDRQPSASHENVYESFLLSYEYREKSRLTFRSLDRHPLGVYESDFGLLEHEVVKSGGSEVLVTTWENGGGHNILVFVPAPGPGALSGKSYASSPLCEFREKGDAPKLSALKDKLVKIRVKGSKRTLYVVTGKTKSALEYSECTPSPSK